MTCWENDREFSAAGTTRTLCTDRTEQRAKRHSKQVGGATQISVWSATETIRNQRSEEIR